MSLELYDSRTALILNCFTEDYSLTPWETLPSKSDPRLICNLLLNLYTSPNRQIGPAGWIFLPSGSSRRVTPSSRSPTLNACSRFSRLVCLYTFPMSIIAGLEQAGRADRMKRFKYNSIRNGLKWLLSGLRVSHYLLADCINLVNQNVPSRSK